MSFRRASPRRGRRGPAATSAEAPFPVSSTSASPPRHRRPVSSLAEADVAVETVEDVGNYYAEPRSFPHSVKQQCWEKADRIQGRDPDRWRRDPVGNIVFRKLVGCSGCLCHDYDHILPFSKGGKSTLDNCQVLQAKVNRSKGNNTDISKADLVRRSAYCRVSGKDMDLLELAAYGNVQHGQDSGGCKIQ